MTKFNKLLMSAGILAVASLSFATAPAFAQSDNWNALFDRIIRIEHEIKALKGSGGGGAAQGAAQGSESYRLTAIENQLRRLLGSVDTVRDQMRDMQARLKRLEQRKSSRSNNQRQVAETDPLPTFSMSTFESYSSENSDLDLTVLPEGSDTELDGTNDTTQGQAQFQSVPQSQVLGQLTIDSGGGLPGSGHDESSLLPGQVESAALDDPTGATSGGSEDLYESSYKNLLSRRFGMAEAGFKTFISKNPKHPQASKAQYWLGETYYVQGRYKQAAQSFLAGYRNYPKGARAPESLLKLGMSLNKLGQKKQACGAYSEVRKSYPSAQKTSKRAARESKRAGC